MSSSPYTEDNVAAFIDSYIQHLTGELASLARVAKAVPEDKLQWAPHPKSMPAATLALHCADSITWFADAIRDGSFKMEEMNKNAYMSKKKFLADLKLSCETCLQKLKTIDKSAYLRDVPFLDGNKYPGVGYINWGIMHLIHHRGQLSTYLRVMGAKVPSIYGPSADEGFAAGA